MTSLQVHLLGQFRMRSADEYVVELESRKVQDFLGFLLLNHRQPCRRESLAELFWGDAPFNHSKKYLRQALWKIQSALGADLSGTEKALLLVDAEWVQVNPEASWWLDVRELEATFERVRGKPGDSLSQQEANDLKRAAQLYQGELLEGCYQDWCLLERQRIRFIYHAILDKVIHWSEANGDYETGVGYAALILRDDGARERTHRQLMRMYYLLGNRTEALRQYQLCADVLAHELNIRPGRETERLHELIQEDQGVDGLKRSRGLQAFEMQSHKASGELRKAVNEVLHLSQNLLDAFQRLQKAINKVQYLTKE